MKCRYKNCLCEDREIPAGEEVRVKTMYYHKKCYETKQNISEIVETFSEMVNKNVVYSQLYSVINNIVFTKNIKAEYVLFGLNYYISHKIPLNYPQGLYYVIQNKDVLKEYNKLKADEIAKNMDFNEVEIANQETKFTYKPSKSKGFGDILGGQ